MHLVFSIFYLSYILMTFFCITNYIYCVSDALICFFIVVFVLKLFSPHSYISVNAGHCAAIK